MHWNKILIPLMLLSAILCAILLTGGLSTSNASFYIAALWAGVVLFVSASGVLLVVYKNLVGRLRVANERLVELRFLLERRYELSRERLDNLLDASNHFLSHSEDYPNSRAATRTLAGISEFDNLVSRLQRIERRIIGRLENELLSNDRQVHQIEELLQTLKETNHQTK